MQKIFILLVVIAYSSYVSGQAPAKSGSTAPEPRGVARLNLTPFPGQVPTTLKELSTKSTLIIEGSVQKVLQPRETSPGSLETDAVISVTSTLKGPVSQKIMMSQRGGVAQKFSVVPSQYKLVQPGETYLLFLIEDKRPNTPFLGLQRYLVAGIWSGLFYFQGGRMVLTAESRDPLRSKYDGQTREQILAEVSAVLGQ